MFILFVAQLGAHGPLWAIGLGPRPIVGYRTRPKAQPIRGLGWVGPGPTWALTKPTSTSPDDCVSLELGRKSSILTLLGSAGTPAEAAASGLI
jgi:hypothetical protein